MSDFLRFVDMIKMFGLEYINLYSGWYPAEVAELVGDPGLGRIKVRVSVLQLPSNGVHPRVCYPLSGPYAPGDGFGSYWTPRVGDRVWVHFRHGNVNDPVYMPVNTIRDNQVADEFKDVEARGIKTHSGHVLRFKDGEQKELLVQHSSGTKVEVMDDGSMFIESKDGDLLHLDSTGNKVELKHRSGSSLTMNASNVVVTNGAGSKITLNGTKAEIEAVQTTVKSASIVLDASSVALGGSSAGSPLVKGDMLMSYLSQLTLWMTTHFHTSAAPGAPTTPTVVPPPLASPSILSNTSRTK